MTNIFKSVGAFFMDIVEVFVIALAIFVLVYLFLFQPHQVRGSSMIPNFQDKEYLLTDKISYRFNEPKRGEVIIFKAPKNQEYEYIKRVIGIPGDKVMLSEGKVFVNNQLLEEDYLPDDFYTRGGSFLKDNQETVVTEGSYFVLGDNRSHSSDSREWGLVPRNFIVGKAWFRYWPPEEIGLVKEAQYSF